MRDIDNEQWYNIYKVALDNPLQGTVLTQYSLENVKEMETKVVFIKNKQGQIKIAAMAIKNAIEYESGQVKIDENGENVKEATGLFALDIKKIDEDLLNDIFSKNSDHVMVEEPKNWGKKGEPNIVLSVLQRTIFEDKKLQNHRIEGSNFGSYLTNQYAKMGKSTTFEIDFDYNELGDHAKSKYVEFLREKLPKEYGENIKSEDIYFDYETHQVLVDGQLAKKEKIQAFHDKYLKYYETILNKDSEEYKNFKKIMDSVYKSNISEISSLDDVYKQTR